MFEKIESQKNSEVIYNSRCGLVCVVVDPKDYARRANFINNLKDQSLLNY